ncbi:hypothetical protein [Alkalibacterium indicireducens]
MKINRGILLISIFRRNNGGWASLNSFGTTGGRTIRADQNLRGIANYR